MFTTDQLEFLDDSQGNPYIRVKTGPHEGFTFSLGAVSFSEPAFVGADATMHFKYDIIDESTSDYSKADLEQSIGDLIVAMIKKMEPENLLYANGT